MAAFGAVGAASTATEFAVYAALVAAGVAPVMANAASFLAANLQGYVLNARVTFRRNGRRSPLSMGGYARYLSAYLAGFAITSLIVLALADAAGPLGAKAIAIVFATVSNYVLAARFVFSPPTASGSESP